MIKKVLVVLGVILIIFVCLLYVLIFHPKFIDKKKNWSEFKYNNYVEYTYSYFDGKQRIPILAKKGQHINIEYTYYGDGGIGFTVINPNNRFVEISRKGSRVTIFTEMDGEYQIELTGNDMSNGSIQLRWTIE
ncbi:hypothetical protein [Paenibacillus rigui]|uniref:Uncharacterized protein n=1 Tax=Paenibacillus rigui TaxID=554312 RepID=A0A229UIP4_9BACL|nr:hypothetical protein [Paenibacillus rigui]OXM83276.1 hypothetical protein CF651_26475 [Paenibacillus rigui]